MTPIPKSVSVFYFFAGILAGLLIGMSINKEWSSVVARFIASSTIILFALFWRRIESLAHGHYMETWSLRRSHGKWRFILTHYVLIRGVILFLTVAGPMLPALAFNNSTFITLFASILVLVLLLAYLGHEAWTECEQDYGVELLRQAAERSRIASN